jgi:hypothetical protein
VITYVSALLIFGPEFNSALSSPFRWCVHRLGAITGIFGEIATYIVRSRGLSVVLAIAMGLEGYRHQLPLIEQCPRNVSGVKYENMPTGAQADQKLVHAAYYTDDECIVRIADWIAAEDGMCSNAAIAGEARRII